MITLHKLSLFLNFLIDDFFSVVLFDLLKINRFKAWNCLSDQFFFCLC